MDYIASKYPHFDKWFRFDLAIWFFCKFHSWIDKIEEIYSILSIFSILSILSKKKKIDKNDEIDKIL